MLAGHVSSVLESKLGYSPTLSQVTAMRELADFMVSQDERELFLLRGYAGTGKTTLINALVMTLDMFGTGYVLMAPTGRAAKVLAGYTGRNAYTIHKTIYRQRSGTEGDVFELDFNKYKDTFFIVDEASMISDTAPEQNLFGSGNLLHDLAAYIGRGTRCRLLLIGDDAQLPPVGLDISPALNVKVLENLGYIVKEAVLTDVIRQSESSGILHYATGIRNQIHNREFSDPGIQSGKFKDVELITGNELIEMIESCYNKYGAENVMIINRSNKLANKYNQGIRNKVLWREDELSPGDRVMIVKNNYFWLEESEKTGFIANGDIAEIIRLHTIKELYGFRFADVLLRFHDYDELEVRVNILMDTLYSENASLTAEDMRRLYQGVAEDYSDISNKRKLMLKMREDPYFNALQVKFAWAVTCHKAQGGQWDIVFIDQGYMTREMISYEYLRWLYTAFTRPVKKLFLVNFRFPVSK